MQPGSICESLSFEPLGSPAPSSISSLAFSPDGRWVIDGNSTGRLYISDASTGAAVRTLMGHSDPITGLAFLSGGRWLVTSSSDETIKVWDLQVALPSPR